MVQLAVVVKNSTVAALSEHSASPMGTALPLNQTESLVLLDAEVVRRLLDLARPEDTCIDEAIMRLAL